MPGMLLSYVSECQAPDKISSVIMRTIMAGWKTMLLIKV